MKSSSFVRKNAAVIQDPGIRPGLHGQTLISTGHPDLDRLLGGGLPLGTLLLILEDEWSTHHKTFAKYFLAEGAACKQAIYLATSTAHSDSLSSFLPLRTTPSSKTSTDSGRKDDATDDGNEGRDQDYKLRIAWQYQRYSAGGASGGSSSSSSGGSASSFSRSLGGKDWCHQYDLTKPAGEEQLAESGAATEIVRVSGLDSLTQVVSSVSKFIRSLKVSTSSIEAGVAAASNKGPLQGKMRVGRLAVLSLGKSPEWDLQQQQQNFASSEETHSPSSLSILQALTRLKAAVRDTPCAVMVTVPAALHPQAELTRMSHIADTVLMLESVHDESDIARLAPDPSSVAGLLCLKKVASLGSIAGTAPEVPLYLIRYKRKRIAITSVEIDPDAEAREAAAAVAGGGNGVNLGGSQKSAASVICGGPTKGIKNDILDF